MLNFRLNKFHQRATAHISQAQCAWKCKRNTIINLYLTTLTFTETRLLIWWGKLLNFLLFLLFFWNKLFSGLCTDLLTSFPGILCRSCLLRGLTGPNNHGGGGKIQVAFPGSNCKLSSEVRRFGYVSGKLSTYPFPKPTLTLSSTQEICFQSETLST